jgi:hypothetical protein
MMLKSAGRDELLKISPLIDFRGAGRREGKPPSPRKSALMDAGS